MRGDLTSSPQGTTDPRTASTAARALVRECVSEALDCPCQPGDDFGDFCDAWYPGEGAEVTLSVELLDGTLSMTRLSCWPHGAGYGTAVVSALRDLAQDHGLRLEVPDPFESSLGFWRRFQWRDVGAGDRVVLRAVDSS